MAEAKFTVRSHTTPAGWTMHHIYVGDLYLCTPATALHSSAPATEKAANRAAADAACAEFASGKAKLSRDERQIIAAANKVAA